MSVFRKHIDYRTRRTHVADIKEPVVRALNFHRYAQMCRDGAGPLSSDPDARESYDFWMAEAERASDRCRAILAELHSSRELERLADNHPTSPAAAELAVA